MTKPKQLDINNLLAACNKVDYPEDPRVCVAHGIAYMVELEKLFALINAPLAHETEDLRRRLKLLMVGYAKAVSASVLYCYTRDPKITLTEGAIEAAKEITSTNQLSRLVGQSLGSKDWKIPALMIMGWLELKLNAFPPELKFGQTVEKELEENFKPLAENLRRALDEN